MGRRRDRERRFNRWPGVERSTLSSSHGSPAPVFPSGRNGKDTHDNNFERRSRQGSLGQRKSNPSRRHTHAKRNGQNFLNCGFFAYLLVASFNYFISQSISDIVTWGGKYQPFEKTPLQFKVVPTDEKSEMFLRTGQLPGKGNSQKTSSSANVNRLKRQSSTTKNADADNPRGGTFQEMKRNRRGVKSVNAMDDWPPISSLIDSTGTIEEGVDISGFLDFSIIGFPKTGTTSLHRHLSELTNSLAKEQCDLVVNGTSKLLRKIYDDLIVVDNQLLRGIKCPQDVSADWSMHQYAKYFPRTKLIVGVRHPIFWFESLYNFRVSNVPWKKILPTSKLTKGCPPGSQGVCGWRANFHVFLARLGKTPLLSPFELELLSQSTAQINPVKSSVGPVLIYELSQLSTHQFRRDLKSFLGLTRDIPPLPQVDTSGRFDHLPAVERKTAQEKIDICNLEHDAIRSALMKKARNASIWIRDYFLESEDVMVSNRPYFETILKSWMHDPCR